MRDKSKKIAEFGDIQHAVLISVGHLEFSLDEAQQLVLTHGAFVVLTVAMAGAFVHVGTSNDDCPRRHLKKLSKAAGAARGRGYRAERCRHVG
jgi:hypothetical protein